MPRGYTMVNEYGEKISSRNFWEELGRELHALFDYVVLFFVKFSDNLDEELRKNKK